MTRALSLLIALILTAAFITMAVIIMILPSETVNYDISYDSGEGVITVTFEEPLPAGEWTCTLT